MKSLLILLIALIAIESAQSYGWRQPSFGSGRFGGGNLGRYGGNYGGYGRGPYGARRPQFGTGIPMHGGLIGKKK